MLSKKIFYPILLFIYSFVLLSAQGSGEAAFKNGIYKFVNKINEIFLEPILTILVVASVLFFIKGIISFLSNTEGSKKEDGKKHMLWGIVGLFIIFTVWGFLNLITDTVNSI